MGAKRTFRAADESPQRTYRLLTATIAPRMVGLVATRSALGVDNLAPYSAFTFVSVEPPLIGFTSFGVKDTVNNIRETGEFSVTVATPGHIAQFNQTAASFPADVSEFVECGIAPEPGTFVSAPRPAAGRCTVECRLHEIARFGDSHFVVGEVIGWVVDAEAIDDGHPEGPHPMPEVLRPVAKLGTDEWATLGGVFRLDRPAYHDRQKL